MENNKVTRTHLNVMYALEGSISLYGDIGVYETFISENKDKFDDRYGVGNWVVTKGASLPDDIEFCTVRDSAIVPASDEIVSRLRANKTKDQNENIRTRRRSLYQSDEIEGLYWDWQETGDDQYRVMWLEAKNRVRTELPYQE